MAVTFIGLGSNLDQPIQQLQRAILALGQLNYCQLQKVSPFYRTKPVGPVQQAYFINAVAQLTTNISPFLLLLYLQRIEHQQGRLRTQRWGPRTLDLDLLRYDNVTLHTPQLTLPHPELMVRPFVLNPMADIVS